MSKLELRSEVIYEYDMGCIASARWIRTLRNKRSPTRRIHFRRVVRGNCLGMSHHQNRCQRREGQCPAEVRWTKWRTRKRWWFLRKYPFELSCMSWVGVSCYSSRWYTRERMLEAWCKAFTRGADDGNGESEKVALRPKRSDIYTPRGTIGSVGQWPPYPSKAIVYENPE